MPRSKISSQPLPKWPAMSVVGRKVSLDQAAEILMRTNSWHTGCNDHAWEEIVWDVLGVKVQRQPNGFVYADFDSLDEARRNLRCLELEYLSNHRVMSSWFGGPHGWCHWDGQIESRHYNIGKWPTVDEVRADWVKIAEAFPFLTLRCQLWDGEVHDDHRKPVVEFQVANGKVRASEPRQPTIPLAPMDFASVSLSHRERGCNEATLREALRLTRHQAEQAGPRPSAWARLDHEAF